MPCFDRSRNTTSNQSLHLPSASRCFWLLLNLEVTLNAVYDLALVVGVAHDYRGAVWLTELRVAGTDHIRALVHISLLLLIERSLHKDGNLLVRRAELELADEAAMRVHFDEVEADWGEHRFVVMVLEPA